MEDNQQLSQLTDRLTRLEEQSRTFEAMRASYILELSRALGLPDPDHALSDQECEKLLQVAEETLKQWEVQEAEASAAYMMAASELDEAIGRAEKMCGVA